MRLVFTAIFVLLGSALSITEMSSMSVESMERVFARSHEAHTAAMSDMMRSMTVRKAMAVMEKSNVAKGDLAQIKNLALHGKGHLRAAPKGYAGVDGARKLLNQMIYEAFMKYDQEVLRCVDFYSEQCAAMYECRGQISESNYIAANARSLVLDSQGRINWCEVEIPTKEYDLKRHNAACDRELSRLHEREKLVSGDIAIMEGILKMTDCDANKKSFMQSGNLDVLKCTDKCTKKSFIAFNDERLQETVNRIKSKVGKDLLEDTFADLFAEMKGLQSVEATPVQTLMQTGQPIINVTNFTQPPEKRVEIPADPCNDLTPYPTKNSKEGAKCVLSPGSCYKLQERFLNIEAGMQDEKDQLLQSIKELESYCEEIRTTLSTEIDDAKSMQSEAEIKLAKATEDISDAMKVAHSTWEKNSELDSKLRKEMDTCNKNYMALEGEICALKKIRGELYKIKGGPTGAVPFFQDCEVGKWEAQECNAKCGGGLQKLTRKILAVPEKGAACLPLKEKRNCNMRPCPVDCKLRTWSTWTKCSAECDEGVQQRLREVEQAEKYDGKKCGKTSETRSCNTQPCEQDCELSDWSPWSPCSKDCDGGTSKRTKYIKKGVVGQGSCADRWDVTRLEYKKCNEFGCQLPEMNAPMPCYNPIDVVLLIDGSGSLGKKGWKAEKKMAGMFVDSFKGGSTNLAVILFSGPRTWGGVYRCMGYYPGPPPNMETVCKIKSIDHFTTDMKKVHTDIDAMSWPQGSTLTSLALMTAKSELAYGSKDHKSIVIVITDGKPLSFRSTGISARQVRKTARLVWVPVTQYAPLSSIKKWATR